MKTLTIAAAVLAAALPAALQAQAIPTTASANGGYSGDLATINDNFAPPNETPYNQDSVYNFGSTVFTLTFAGPAAVTGFDAAVDNNDDYIVTLFGAGGATYSQTILASDGTVPVNPGGFDNFSFTFAPFVANYATISAANGDGLYGIGELDFFGRAAAVPEPATWAMMLAGFGLIGAGARRRKAAAVRLA